MTDIVERLRDRKATRMEAIEVMEDAADEIERLRAENKPLREMLEWLDEKIKVTDDE